MPKKKAGRAKMPKAAATAARYRLPTAWVTPAPSAVWQKAVSAQPSPAPARAWPSPRRERVLSAKRPPAQAPSARQASTTPMRLVQTMAEVPTCGASTRPPTISSTMTSAPLKKTVSSSIPGPFSGGGRSIRRIRRPPRSGNADYRPFCPPPAVRRPWRGTKTFITQRFLSKKSRSRAAQASARTPPICQTR